MCCFFLRLRTGGKPVLESILAFVSNRDKSLMKDGVFERKDSTCEFFLEITIDTFFMGDFYIFYSNKGVLVPFNYGSESEASFDATGGKLFL